MKKKKIYSTFNPKGHDAPAVRENTHKKANSTPKVIKKSKAFDEERQLLYLLKTGKHKEIMNFLNSQTSICYDEFLVALIEAGNHEEIMRCLAICWYLPDEAQSLLVKRYNHEEIMLFLERAALDYSEAQNLLIKRGNHEEIMKIIDSMVNVVGYGCFSDDAEINLCKRGNLEEISSYLTAFELCGKARQVLLQLGHNENVACLIAKQCLTEEEQIFLIQRSRRKEILTYDHVWGFTPRAIDKLQSLFPHLVDELENVVA